ncbi:AMP-binding enzyme [Sorangium sp. So ce1000]|uniref:AMP-binding enzyme n=1 Tax=Sorangium sp. So ce1000 TaxID=3133325 RepID=UPI003F63AB9B
MEAALLRHPSVREAAVVGHASAGGGKHVSAFLVAGDPAPSPAELRRHARSLLPAAAVPSAFVLTDRLPRTSSGEIDLKALRRSPQHPQNSTIDHANITFPPKTTHLLNRPARAARAHAMPLLPAAAILIENRSGAPMAAPRRAAHHFPHPRSRRSSRGAVGPSPAWRRYRHKMWMWLFR